MQNNNEIQKDLENNLKIKENQKNFF